jgi:hypothetical protein
MNKSKLSCETKMLIQKYLIKRLMVFATAASIISFLLGLFIKDIAKAEAYNKAYSEAAQTIMQITSEATESANKIKNLEDQISKLTVKSELVLKDATELKEKIKTTVVIQQSANIVSAVTENLSNNLSFQNAITSKTATRISQLESKTKNISIDASGNTVFENEIKTFGEIQAYNFVLMKKR